MARPRYFDARSASFRAMAPAVDGFHGLAFLRGGMTAWAPRPAMALWHSRVSQAPSAVTDPISTSAGIRPSNSGRIGRITNAATGDLDGPNFQRLLVDAPLDECMHSPVGQWMWILRRRRRFAPPCLRA
jgi:hypothetical protein